MDAPLAQARRDLTGTSDELKRTSAQNASKIDELLRRVRELESELNSKSTELNITTEQRNNARESLAKLTAVHKDYKLELEEKVADLSGKLERVTADAKSAQQLAAAERKGLQSQVDSLTGQLEEALQVHRASGDDSQRRMWDLESKLEDKTREIAQLVANADSVQSRLERTLRAEQDSVRETQVALKEQRERFEGDRDELQTALNDARSEHKEDKRNFRQQEETAAANAKALLSSHNALQLEVKLANDKITELAEALQTSERSGAELANQLRTANTTELAESERKLRKVQFDLRTATGKLQEMESSQDSHSREMAALEVKFQKKLDAAASENAAVLAKLKNAEHRRKLDVADATAGIQGQLDMYISMVADIKQDKQNSLEAVKMLKTQLEESSRVVAETSSELTQAKRRLQAERENFSSQQKDAEDRAAADAARLREQLLAFDRSKQLAKDEALFARQELQKLKVAEAHTKATFETFQRENVQLLSSLEAMQASERRLLQEQVKFEQKLQASNDDNFSKQTSLQARVADAEAKARDLELEKMQAEQKIVNLQNELLTRERANTLERKKEQARADEDLRVRTKDIEEAAELKLAVVKHELAAAQYELEYFKSKSEDSKRTAANFDADRKQYELDLQQLRANLNESECNLEAERDTFLKHKANQENIVRGLKSDYELKVAEGVQRGLAALRRKTGGGEASFSTEGSIQDSQVPLSSFMNRY